MRLSDLAREIGGRSVGDDVEITGAGGIEDVQSGEITLIKDKKSLQRGHESPAAAFIVPPALEEMIDRPALVSDNPMLSFVRALEVFYERDLPRLGVLPGAHLEDGVSVGPDVTVYPLAYISRGVRLGSGVTIYPGVFIGEGAEIGDNTVIHPGVVIREGVRIGRRVIIHPNAVIGADGFGYLPEEGRHRKIPQVGGVVIGDDVEIGACATIDRATTGNTVIGEGTKVDNLVQIAHNVTIGKHSIIVSLAGIAGSTKIGDHVTLAGQVGVSDHAEIESNTVVGAMSGVMGRLTSGIYLGAPARPHREYLRLQGLFARLPELFRDLRDLKEEVKRLREICRTEENNNQPGGKDD